ncbi:probable ubiquitin-like-specific protease 2B isoform X2 [Hibiscus syriacus]|uniref:probable ubiquitin-like-specific protease 2B isoform X2 n=1 Tax=Hibiscus syriacus TaxID=106335 RepID=UPI0019241C20|nr:probable ubiquitin-like-specific protease 2B isoform X2 [Hibiscus syriacus]
MNNGFEVFEFKEEDGISELTADKCFCKLRNPNSDDPATMECQFLECDVGGIDGATPAASLGPGENEFAKEGNTELDVSPESKSTSSEQQPDLEKYMHKCGSTFPEFESRNSFSEAPSPGKRQLSCPLSSSPLINEPVDMTSDGNGSMSERSTSNPISDVAEDNVSLNGNVVDHFDGNIPMDNIDREVVICPEYVVYQDNYYTGVSVIFSPDGIKIECSTVSYHHVAFSFERGVDDIINIHCQWFQRGGCMIVNLKVLSKVAAEAENECSTSFIEELKFTVFDSRWSEKQEAITSLNHKYLAMWNIVFDPLMEMDGDDSPIHKSYFPNFDEPFEEVIYPKGDFDAVSISKRDVDLLEPETFINDTIIDFYIKYLKNQIEPEERQRFHFFNSFFFRKLADLDKDPSSISDGRAAFVRVRKWTRKLDMFGKDYIFIPVNFNLHWSLLVICHPGEVAAFKDEDLAKSSKVPCILHMDSIRGNHAGLKNLVQSYLWEEWKERHKETSEDFSSKFLNLRFVSLELPQQENSFDCGLFLLHYLELFLAEAPPNFNPFKIIKFSNFLNLDWFPPTEASLKRTLIQKLIFELLEVRSQEISSSHCSDDNNSSEKIKNENGMEFISGSFSTEVADHGNLDSQAGREIEMTLLASSSMRNMGSVNDSGLVLREFFDPGVTTGPLLGQFQSFDQPPYYNLNEAISPTEEVQTGQQFTYLASGETGFPQFSGITPQACEPPYSSGGFGMGSTWNPEISMQGDHEVDTSSETSASGDEDDDIGIIECNPFQVNEERIQRRDTVQEQSHLVENVVSLKKVSMPASVEVLETSISEVCGASEDTVKTWISTVDADLCSTDDLPLLLHQNPGAAVNRLDQDPELIKNNAEKVENKAIDDNVQTIGEDLPSVDNSTLSLSRNPDMLLKRLDQDSEPVENKEAKADDFPHEDNSTMFTHQNPSTVLNQLNQDSEMVENKDTNDHDVQITSNDMSAEIAEQPVAKRMRLTPSDEEKVDS